MTKPKPGSKPPTIGTPQSAWPSNADSGGIVVCARCRRERQRGVRCSCERPMRED